jgi:hypothetical protein
MALVVDGIPTRSELLDAGMPEATGDLRILPIGRPARLEG